MGEGFKLRLVDGEELCDGKIQRQRVGLGRRRLGALGEGKVDTSEKLTTWRQKGRF
jgi:hypothetical protein